MPDADRKREPHAQPPRPAKPRRAKVAGTWERKSKRFIDKVRSQMFQRL